MTQTAEPATVLVTGASGYIAKHIVHQLLAAGHTVVGSVRKAARDAEVRDALRPHLPDGALDRYRSVELDLDRDTGWSEAMQGVDVLMHTASPFPLSQPRNADDVIRPAVQGALRAVKAAHAAGITRVIMTSSSAAIANTALPAGRSAYTEDDWTDIDHPAATPYVQSKTLAERAVWDWHRSDAPDMRVTMINPTFVQGAPLDTNYGTSAQVIQRLLRAKDPMLPNFGFPTVDVRDIALMHVRALERPESAGHRFVGSDRFLWFPEIARLLQDEFPDRRIAKPTAPNMVVRFLGLFDPAIRSIVPILGERHEISAQKARDMLGIDFRDARDSVRELGRFLVAEGRA